MESHVGEASLMQQPAASAKFMDKSSAVPAVDENASVMKNYQVYQHVLAAMLTHSGEMPPDLRAEMEIKLFHFAVKGDLRGASSLIEHGISVDAVDYNGRSALHLASERGQLEIVEYLIQRRAKVDCKDSLGETPMTLAIKGDHQAVQQALVRAGAKHSEKLDGSKFKRSMNASFAVMEAFPHQIAAAMLEGRKIEPISKDCVSLLFSDIVGFTAMSSTMDAAKVSNMLNRLFKKFDRLAYLHGVQKVDVIGDAYIAAANFLEHQPLDHAARLARFAIDAIKAARETRIEEGQPGGGAGDCLSPGIRIRVGMHCGPVSGSVVGSQGLKYTLMGDAVNVAARMESSCLPCQIQCSEASAALIAAQASEVVLRPRDGGVVVKGKGFMQTYWVTSLRQGLRRHSSCPDLAALRRAAPDGADGADGDVGGGGDEAGHGGGGRGGAAAEGAAAAAEGDHLPPHPPGRAAPAAGRPAGGDIGIGGGGGAGPRPDSAAWERDVGGGERVPQLSLGGGGGGGAGPGTPGPAAALWSCGDNGAAAAAGATAVAEALQAAAAAADAAGSAGGGFRRTPSDAGRRIKSVCVQVDGEADPFRRLQSDGWLAWRSLNRL